MKTRALFSICLLLAIASFSECFAQKTLTEIKRSEVIAPELDRTIITIGVSNGLHNSVINQYLYNNIKYPEKSIDCCIQGTEVVKFTVLTDGTLEGIEVINSICPEIDEETVRILKTTDGMWIPGKENGLPINMEKELLITFHLDGFHFGTDKEYFKKKATRWYIKGNRALFEKENLKKALKCYNNGIRFRPLEDALLNARAIVKYELDDIDGAQKDWDRLKRLVFRGENEKYLTILTENFKNFAGYYSMLK